MNRPCSIRQMAEFLHMPKSTLHSILKSKNPTPTQTRKIAKALQVSHRRLVNCPPEKIEEAIIWRMNNTDWFDAICDGSPA